MTEGASTLMDTRLLAAEAVAREAGAAARRRFLDRSFTVSFKSRQDYLTEVDGETEAFIAERLLQVFPNDGFIGEESKARPAGDGGATWVVDPIDGTANFARGVPHFCVDPRSRSAGTCARAPSSSSICCGGSPPPGRRPRAPAPGRCRSPMSPRDGEMDLSSIISMHGIVSPGSCWSARRADM